MHIHSNIRILRKKAGITQKELATKLDKTYITIGDYERGKATPPLVVILQLCDIFDVDLQTLVHHDMQNYGLATAPPNSDELTQLRQQSTTQLQLIQLQQQRLADLERAIREHAPELAQRLGLTG